MGAARTRVYRSGVLEREGFAVADVSEWLDETDTVVWIDFCGPTKDELHEAAGELGLHELAVEDALGPHQRPKVDHYESHLFLSCHAVYVDLDGGGLNVSEVDAFIGDRWLVTVRKDNGFSMDPVLARWDRVREPRRVRRELLPLRVARRDRRRLFRDRRRVRRLLRHDQRGDLR